MWAIVRGLSILLCISVGIEGFLSSSNKFVSKSIQDRPKSMVMNDNNVNMNELDQLSTPMAAIQSPISNTDNIKKVAYSALPICLSLMSGLVGLPADAQAATTDALTPLFSAFTAYGHYFGLVVVTAALMTERLLIKPGMPIEDQKKVIIADIIYGIVGLLIVVTGYLRVTQYGKGWDFYSHEPVFWVKLVLVGIWGSSSLFPTIKLIQRGLMIKDLDDGKVTSIEPVSEKLSARLTKIINGELLAVAAIPLSASLMSRGVGHVDDFPWQAGAAAVALAVFGLGFTYVKEAFDFQED